jgi:hypothetical protein
VLGSESLSFELEYPCDSPFETRWFLMRVLPLQGPEGGAVVSHTDITRRKGAEENALKSSNYSYISISIMPYFSGTGRPGQVGR